MKIQYKFNYKYKYKWKYKYKFKYKYKYNDEDEIFVEYVKLGAAAAADGKEWREFAGRWSSLCNSLQF